MPFIPVDEAVASDLAGRGVYPLMVSEYFVPDAWLSLLEQLHDLDDTFQLPQPEVNGSPP